MEYSEMTKPELLGLLLSIQTLLEDGKVEKVLEIINTVIDEIRK